MTIILKKPYHQDKKVDDWFANLKPKKCFDADKFAGKIVWDEDPVAYQKRLRNEWK